MFDYRRLKYFIIQPIVTPFQTVASMFVVRKQQISCDICAGPYIARVQRGQLPPPGKLNFFPNIEFGFAELFLVAILVQNHKKIH